MYKDLRRSCPIEISACVRVRTHARTHAGCTLSQGDWAFGGIKRRWGDWFPPSIVFHLILDRYAQALNNLFVLFLRWRDIREVRRLPKLPLPRGIAFLSLRGHVYVRRARARKKSKGLLWKTRTVQFLTWWKYEILRLPNSRVWLAKLWQSLNFYSSS